MFVNKEICVKNKSNKLFLITMAFVKTVYAQSIISIQKYFENSPCWI